MSLNHLPLRLAACAKQHSVRSFSTSLWRCQTVNSANDLTTIVGPRSSDPLTSISQKMYGMADRSEKTQQERQEVQRQTDYVKQLHRKWNAGDVYAPHDLTGREQAKWKKARGQRQRQGDAIDQLGVNPLLEYKNFTMMSEFMTEMGRIKHSKITGLRPKNQRKMAKAVRRAVGLGLMPSVYRHPLVLKYHRSNRFS